MIPEENFNTRARVEELADDLDAGGLRELMERDRRRREKRKKSEQAKLQKMLERKADKQKLEETDKQKVLEDAEKKDTGNGLGIVEAPIPQQGASRAQDGGISSPNRDATASPASWLQDPSQEHLPRPVDSRFHDPNSESRLDLVTPTSEKEEPIIETAKAIRLSQASMSPPNSPALSKQALGPSNLSNVHVPPEEPQEHVLGSPDPTRLQPPEPGRDPDTSGRLTGAWNSFFRRSGTKVAKDSSEKDRATPSEFSNTSRESFARQQKAPPPVVQRSFKRKASSGIPQRTMSKFREDLPELPISPPESRIQSPELRSSSPYIDHSSKLNDDFRAATPLGDVHPAFRDEVATSRGQSLRSPSPEGPSSALLSQSLASVDSEGSWLSGRPAKRSSIPISSVRESVNSLAQPVDEEGSISEERYFTRRDPSPGKFRGPGGLTSQLRQINTTTSAVENEDDYMNPSETVSPLDEDDGAKYYTVKGHKPNIVQRALAAKSREGLLQDFAADEVSPISTESPDTPVEGKQYPGALTEGSSIQRATSVEYGKQGHARKVSAGSARLLDIPRRGSGDYKRLSTQSTEKSPLSSSFDKEEVAGPSSKAAEAND